MGSAVPSLAIASIFSHVRCSCMLVTDSAFSMLLRLVAMLNDKVRGVVTGVVSLYLTSWVLKL